MSVDNDGLTVIEALHPERLDRIVNNYVDSAFPGNLHSSPGGVIAIQANGEAPIIKPFGQADYEQSIPFRNETRFPVASITKPIVAYALLKLAEHGMVSLDDPVSEYVDVLSDWDKKPTLDQLLSMTAGLRHDEVVGCLFGTGEAVDHSFLRRILNAQKSPMDLSENTQVYCCGGYRVLADVIEAVTQKTFSDALQEIVFSPLDMRDSSIFHDWADAPKGRCFIYKKALAGWRRTNQTGQSSGDGALLTTALDLVKFSNHLLSDGAEKLSQMKNGAPYNGARYGYGVMLDKVAELNVVGHSGSSNSHWITVPEKNLTIVALLNNWTVRASDAVFALLEQILSLEEGRQSSGVRPGLYLTSDDTFLFAIEGGTEKTSRRRIRPLASSVAFPLHTIGHTTSNTLWGSCADLTLSTADGGLKIREGRGPDKLALQVDPWAPSQKDMNTLPGVYWSDEYGAPAHIVVQDDTLILQFGNGARTDCRLPLQRVSHAALQADGHLLFLVLDADENVQGFRLSAYRARDLEFKKINP